MQEETEVLGGRQHQRISYAAGSAFVRCSKSGPTLSASLLDVSISGCLLHMIEPTQLTSDQMIEVYLDLTHFAFRAMGFVRHVNRADNSVGVEFYKLSEKDRAELDTFIDFFAVE